MSFSLLDKAASWFLLFLQRLASAKKVREAALSIAGYRNDEIDLPNILIYCSVNNQA
jgi:hypothetical protein